MSGQHDINAELQRLSVQRGRLSRSVSQPYPRAFIVEGMVSFAFIYWGVCFALPTNLFDFPLFQEFHKYHFTESQLGVALVILGVLTAVASLTRIALFRCATLLLQTFAWIFITYSTFRSVPYAPSNSLFILMIILVIAAFLQVSLRVGEPRENHHGEGEAWRIRD